MTTTATTSIVSLIMPNDIKHALVTMARKETRSISGQAIHLLRNCLNIPAGDQQPSAHGGGRTSTNTVQASTVQASPRNHLELFKEAIIEANVTMRRATLSVILNRRKQLAKLSERQLQAIISELSSKGEIEIDTSKKKISYRIAA